MERKWYWEFEVKSWNSIKEKASYSTGIVYADTFTEAVAQIEECYGKELMEINYVKAVQEGPVFYTGLSDDGEDKLVLYPKKFLKKDQLAKFEDLWLTDKKICN